MAMSGGSQLLVSPAEGLPGRVPQRLPLGGVELQAGCPGPGRRGRLPGVGAFPAPASLQLREGEVRGQLAAAEPHRLGTLGGSCPAGAQGDGVGDLVRVQHAHPRPHQHPVPTEPLAELGEAARAGQRGPYLAAQHLPVRASRDWPSRRGTPLGLAGVAALLGPAGVLVTGPVRRRGPGEAVAGLDGQAGLAGPVEVVARPDPLAVLPGQRRDDVDVVVGMPDRDPPHGFLITSRCGADPMQVLTDDVRPPPIAQDLVGLVVDDLHAQSSGPGPADLHSDDDQGLEAVLPAAA